MFVKTLNITDSVSNIETSTTYKYYWVRNLGTEEVSVFKAPSDADTNKKIILSQDEYVKIIPENNIIYFKSSSTGTKIEVYGTNTDICPFKMVKRGSESGSTYKETQLYKYSGSGDVYGTITIAQGHKFSDYDQVLFCGEYLPGSGNKPDVFKYMPSSILENGVLLQRVTDFCHYHLDSTSPDTTIILSGRSGALAITEIIGINY